MKLDLKQTLLAGVSIAFIAVGLTKAYLSLITVDDGLETLIIVPIIFILLFMWGVFYLFTHGRSIIETFVFMVASSLVWCFSLILIFSLGFKF